MKRAAIPHPVLPVRFTFLFLLLALWLPVAVAAAPALTADTDVRFQRPFILGVVAYNQKRYGDAINHLQQALALYPDEPTALTYLFYAAQQHGDHATIIGAGELLVRQDRAGGLIYYMLAKAYRVQGDEARARAAFQRVADAPNDPYRDAAEYALAETGLSYRPHGWHGVFNLGYEYDDNVSPTPVETGQARQNIRDQRLVSYAQAEYQHRLGERFFVGAKALGYDQSHGDAGKFFDYRSFTAGVNAGVVGIGWDVRLDLQRDDAELRGDDYLESRRAIVAANVRAARHYTVTVKGSFAVDDFVDSSLDADRTEYQLLNRLLLPRVKDGASVTLSLHALDNDTDRLSAAGYASRTVRVGGQSPLPWWSLFLDISGGREQREYDMPNPTQRDDTLHDAAVTLTKQWRRHWSNSVYYRRVKNDSTVDAFSYVQHVYGVSLVFAF